MSAIAAVTLGPLLAGLVVHMKLFHLAAALAGTIRIITACRVLKKHHCAAKSFSTHASLIGSQSLLQMILHLGPLQPSQITEVTMHHTDSPAVCLHNSM